MRCLTKIVAALVCLVLLPLCGLSFGQDVNATGMVIKGEVIKPVPGVSVEVALSQQKAKDDLIAQKQALETEPPVTTMPVPDRDKLPILPDPRKGPIRSGDGKKIGIPIIVMPKPNPDTEVGGGLKKEPVGPIIIKIPQPDRVLRFWVPEPPPLPAGVNIKMPHPDRVLRFWPMRFVPPVRVSGLLGSVINITVELTKKEIL